MKLGSRAGEGNTIPLLEVAIYCSMWLQGINVAVNNRDRITGLDRKSLNEGGLSEIVDNVE